MRERDTRSEEQRPERAAPVPPRPRPSILDLQRAAGNRAVTRLLSRQPFAAELPAAADNLRRFREGFPRLRALAGRQVPAAGLDIEPALAWLLELVETLRVVEPIVDPSALVFESIVVTGHDAEYGDADAEIVPQVRATLQVVAPISRDTGTAVRRTVIDAVNASSVVEQDRAPDPALPRLDRATASTRARERAGRARAHGRPRRSRAAGGGTRVRGRCAGAAAGPRRAERARYVALERGGVGPGREHPEPDAPARRGRRHLRRLRLGARQSLRPDGTRDDWCGMFVAASMFRGAAVDNNVRMAFAHTDSVHDFFRYDTSPTNPRRTPASIWAEDRWWGVREYHESRGLPRTWVEGAGVEGAEIRPGDVVLIRHTGAQPADAIANHIVMVDSFDAATGRMVTLEGNVIEGIRADAAGDARRTATGELESTRTAQTSTAVHIRDLRDPATATPGAGPGGTYQERGRRTVFGIGRPSLVDFESHEYGTLPVPEQHHYVSPEEIRRRGLGVPLAPTSTIESPAGSPYRTRTGD
jgi:hypothetical protein